MFGKKAKNALFGKGIEPSCGWCVHNGARQGDGPRCTLGLSLKDGACRKYKYDPLRREPKTAPPLLADRYNEEDFKL